MDTGLPSHRAWAQGIRGAIAILFGFTALFWPGITLLVLVTFFGAYAFIDGVTALIGGIRTAGHHGRWWPLILEGMAGIIAGILTWFWPGLTALFLLYIIAWWAIVTGVIEIVGGFAGRQWLVLFAGIISVAFGLFVLVLPSAGALAVISILAAYAIVFGFIMLAHAFHGGGLFVAHEQPPSPQHQQPPAQAA